MQKALVLRVPSDICVTVTRDQASRCLARDEYDVVLDLVGVELRVGVLPPGHQLRARPSSRAVFLRLRTAPRLAMGAFETAWRLDEPEPREERECHE